MESSASCKRKESSASCKCKESSASCKCVESSASCKCKESSASCKCKESSAIDLRELKSLLRAAGQCRRHFTKTDPLRGSAWWGAKTQGFLRLFLGSRDPLRRSAWSMCKNSRFFAFSAAPARPSAGIGVLEVQKLKVVCDF